MIKKFFKIILILLIILVSCFILAFVYLVFKANPLTHEIKLSAPHGQVTIRRDEFNVPHIHAEKDDDDAFFALGYIHASDRLWQMEFQRRVAAGRLSEIFGKDTIKQDEYLRTWGFYRAATLAWQALDDKTKAIVHAYTAGVNYYLSTNSLPLQFYFLRYKPQPWTDIDSIAWQKMMAWNLDNSWDRKIKNYLLIQATHENKVDFFYPPYPSQSPTILDDDDLKQANLLTQNSPRNDNYSQFIYNKNNLKQITYLNKTIRNNLGFNDATGKGSNAWVISGKFTRSGKPILANDVHLPLSSPSLWYLAELSGPTLHVTGATIPGLPLVAIGHNDHIAWGVTHSYVDTQDLYIEKPDTNFIIRKEIINIKGSSPETFEVKISTHGPIISTISDARKVNQFVAIKWPALQAGDTTVASFAKINYAKNWNEFVDALKYYVSPPQNFLYADTTGNIGYYLSGKIPVRKGWDGSLPVSPDQHLEWEDYIPFDKLPHVYNPSQGFIAAANNKIVNDSFPYNLSFRWNVPPFRIQRIIDEIKRNQNDIEKTKLLQNDVESYLWKELSSSLLKTQPLDQTSKTAIELLSQWDGHYNRESVAATVFAYWYQYLLNPRQSQIQFDPLFLVQQLQQNHCYLDVNTTVDCQRFLSESLQSSLTQLTKEHGKEISQWQWGKIHHVNFQELAIGKSKAIGWIWNRTQATPGGDFTVNVGTYDPKTMQQLVGPTYRQIIDLSDFNKSVYVIPLGQVDNPFSLKYNDQLPLWTNGQYVQMH